MRRQQRFEKQRFLAAASGRQLFQMFVDLVEKLGKCVTSSTLLIGFVDHDLPPSSAIPLRDFADQQVPGYGDFRDRIAHTHGTPL